MGIQGLWTFLLAQEPKLTSPIQLSQVKRLIIDGNNLSHNLYYYRPQELKNRDLYGGDYAHYAQHVRQFFSQLTKFGVEPIVLFDGATKMEATSKLRVESYLKKFSKRIKYSYARRKYNVKFFAWPSASTVLFQVLRDMQIVHLQCIGKSADEIMPVVAQYFDCPVLSNDGDLLLMNIPGGVIELKNFVKNVINSTGKNVDLSMELYKIINLPNVFPKFKDKMIISLAFFLLSTDSFDCEMAKRFITKLQDEIRTNNTTSSNFPYEWQQKVRVETVFKWLSQQDSFEAARKRLAQEYSNKVKKMLENQAKKKSKNSSKTNIILDINRVDPFVEQMKQLSSQFDANLQTKLEELPKNLCIQDFFEIMKIHLFPSISGIPDKIHQGLYEAIINPRLLDILYNKVDTKLLMLEHFDNLTECTHFCTFELDRFLYGLILGQNNTEEVTRIFRVQGLVTDLVIPEVELYCNTNVEFQNFPKASKSVRREWLLKLIQQTCSVDMMEIQSLQVKIKETNQSHPDSMLIMLLSLIMCERKCSDTITQSKKWFPFLRAMFSNVVFIGHIGPCALQTNIPTFLALTPDEKQFLQAKFDSLDQTLSLEPDLEIVHYFNCFHNCLQSINFLIQSLNLYDDFQIDRFVCGLQGTFVHNLTKHLIDESPEYFLYNILGTFENLKNVHEKLWNTVWDSVQGDRSDRTPMKSLESERSSVAEMERRCPRNYDFEAVNASGQKTVPLLKIKNFSHRSSLDRLNDNDVDRDEVFYREKMPVKEKTNYGTKPREPNMKKKGKFYGKRWSPRNSFDISK